MFRSITNDMNTYSLHNFRVASAQTQRGTTLIEMIIYIGIVAVLLLGVGGVSLAAMESKTKTRAMSDVLSGGGGALAAIIRHTEGSAAIVAPTPGATSSTLTLIPRTPGAPSTQITLANGAITFNDGVGAPLLLTPNEIAIDTLVFTGLGAGSTSTGVMITFHAMASSTGVWNSFQYDDTFTTSVLIRSAL
jgi:type II secretory pathway pseudopilin PulG